MSRRTGGGNRFRSLRDDPTQVTGRAGCSPSIYHSICILLYFVNETCRLEPIESPFGPESVTHVSGTDSPGLGAAQSKQREEGSRPDRCEGLGISGASLAVAGGGWHFAGCRRRRMARPAGLEPAAPGLEGAHCPTNRVWAQTDEVVQRAHHLALAAVTRLRQRVLCCTVSDVG